MKSQKGFTLLEVLVTLSILSVIIGYFMLYFSNEIKNYCLNDNDIELRQDARIAMDRIISKIRQNNDLTYVPGPDGTGIIYKGSDILINTTKNDPNGEINFYFDNNKGYGEIRNSAGNVIVDNIKDFRLEKQDIVGTQGLIKITIICGNDKFDDIKEYTTTVRLGMI